MHDTLLDPKFGGGGFALKGLIRTTSEIWMYIR